MKKPYTLPAHLIERARLVRKKRAEYKLGRPLTSAEEAAMELKLERRNRERNRSRASKWAREGWERDADD